MKNLRLLALLSISLFFVVACSIFTSPYSKETMQPLAAALLKATPVVESTVRYKKPDPGLKDRSLFIFATKHDPSLAAPFDAYTIKIHAKNRHAWVLVCSADGSRVLLEDLGCTMKLDRHHWEQAAPGLACEPTISIEEGCSK